jgi:hypothetical protein
VTKVNDSAGKRHEARFPAASKAASSKPAPTQNTQLDLPSCQDFFLQDFSKRTLWDSQLPFLGVKSTRASPGF